MHYCSELGGLVSHVMLFIVTVWMRKVGDLIYWKLSVAFVRG